MAVAVAVAVVGAERYLQLQYGTGRGVLRIHWQVIRAILAHSVRVNESHGGSDVLPTPVKTFSNVHF